MKLKKQKKIAIKQGEGGCVSTIFAYVLIIFAILFIIVALVDFF